MINRRRLIEFAGATVVLAATERSARAQVWPARYVRFLNGFGLGMELVGRIVGNHLAIQWGQQVIVETRAGAGGNIVADAVARSAPDGYTVLITGPSHAINKYLYGSLNHDPIADFEPVTTICTIPCIMAVPITSPAHSVAEFIAYAKANAGRTTYASPGNGSLPHLCAELFKRMAGIEMTHVPYRGAGPAYNDLIPGRVDVMFTILSGVEQIRAGRLRGLATTSASRTPSLPELPTLAESGLVGVDVSTWWAMFVPAKTPLTIIAKMSADVVAALADPTVSERIEKLGATPVGSTPAELGSRLKSEVDRWGRIIKDQNIKLDE
jgi:tripartite-type tricarboxylate transporter receptor subunit TctC